MQIPPTRQPSDSALRCHLSGAPLRDPFLAGDGWTYEHDALEHWLRRQGAISPRTGEAMDGAIVPNHAVARICRQRARAPAAEASAPSAPWLRDLDCIVSRDVMVQPVRLSDGYDYELEMVGRLMLLPGGSPWTGRPFVSQAGGLRVDRTMQALCREAGAEHRDYPPPLATSLVPLLWPHRDPPAASPESDARAGAYLARLSLDGEAFPRVHRGRPDNESPEFWAQVTYRAHAFRARRAEALARAARALSSREGRGRGLPHLLAGPWSDTSHFWAHHRAHRAHLEARLSVGSILPRGEGRYLTATYRAFDAAADRVATSREETYLVQLGWGRAIINGFSAHFLSTLLLSGCRSARQQSPAVVGAAVFSAAYVALHVGHRGIDTLLCPLPDLVPRESAPAPWWSGLQVQAPGLRRHMIRAKNSAFGALAWCGLQMVLAPLAPGRLTGALAAMVGACFGATFAAPHPFFEHNETSGAPRRGA